MGLLMIADSNRGFGLKNKSLFAICSDHEFITPNFSLRYTRKKWIFTHPCFIQSAICNWIILPSWPGFFRSAQFFLISKKVFSPRIIFAMAFTSGLGGDL